MSGDGIRPWRESAVGGHGIRSGCVVMLPDAATAGLIEDIVDGMGAVGFRELEAPAPGVRVLRRGSMLGDTLLSGTGLSLIASKLGPLSLRATVVVETVGDGDGRSRVIVGMVAGDALAPEIAAVVDAALARVHGGVSGPGWMRAVDVPSDSAANPRSAGVRGIR